MLISVDCEMGGIGTEKSLLSLAIVPIDDSFNPVSNLLDINIKPNDGLYKCTAEALSINQINLVEHNQSALTYKEAGTQTYNFLEGLYELNDRKKLIVLGKGVYFDLGFIWEYLLGRATWEVFCSYQILDVSSVWIYLTLIGKVPKLEKTSLRNLAEYFNIDPTTYSLHTACGDAYLTAAIMKKITQLDKN